MDRRLRAPRSLNEAVNCWFSNLSQILQPRMSESVRLQSQSVSTMAPVTRCRAASMSASVTGAGWDASAIGGAETVCSRAGMTCSRASGANLSDRPTDVVAILASRLRRLTSCAHNSDRAGPA